LRKLRICSGYAQHEDELKELNNEGVERWSIGENITPLQEPAQPHSGIEDRQKAWPSTTEPSQGA
jgi:hypothetical protein